MEEQRVGEQRVPQTRPEPPARTREGERPLQELWSEMSADMGRLVRMEVELAKVEATEKLTEAAKAGAMFSSMAVTAFLALQVLSVTAALALALVMPTVLAFLIVGVVYLALTGMLFAQGRKQMAEFSRKPMHGAQNLKEDLRWAKSAVSEGMSGPGPAPSYPGRMWNGQS